MVIEILKKLLLLLLTTFFRSINIDCSRLSHEFFFLRKPPDIMTEFSFLILIYSTDHLLPNLKISYSMEPYRLENTFFYTNI